MGTAYNVSAGLALIPLAAQHLTTCSLKQLAQSVILVPNHRARLQFREALRQFGPVVPNIMPLGELERPWLWQQAARMGGDALTSFCALPRPISAQQRMLALTQYLDSQRIPLGLRALTHEQLIHTARMVCDSWDAMAREGVEAAKLATAAGQYFSDHWQQRLQLLRTATDWWLKYRQQQQCASEVEWRNQVADWLATGWAQHPIDTPVWIVGSTGSHYATWRLMQAIQHLPEGAIWFQGVNTSLLEQDWLEIDPTHPQYIFKQTLQHSDLTRQALQTLGEPCARYDWMTQRYTVGKHYSAPDAEATTQVVRLDARDEHEEADVVAALMREVLETPGKTAALITPDETLMQRVNARLKPLGIQADNAAGLPLSYHPVWQAFCLLAKLALNPDDPVIWLQWLKHPLVTATLPEWETIMPKLELRAFRCEYRQRPLRQRIAQHLPSLPEDASSLAAWRAMLESVATLAQLLGDHYRAWPDKLEAHTRIFHALVPKTDIDNLMASNMAALQDYRLAVEPAQYLACLQALCASDKYFPEQSPHPRLMMLPPIEARLVQADRIILAGLNEGQWPQHHGSQGWLHPSLHQYFGMLPADVQTGVSGLDMALFSAQAGELYLCRSKRRDNVDQLASRWLEALQPEVTPAEPLPEHLVWLRHRHYDLPHAETPASAFSPPLDSRPTQLSPSSVELLVNDPYAFYAKYIMRLAPVEPLEQVQSAKELGLFVHQLMERLNDAISEGQAANTDTYQKILNSLLDAYRDDPIIIHQWGPRLHALADSVIAAERLDRCDGASIEAEQTLEQIIISEPTLVTLKGRADRISKASENQARIIDYKTGQLPSQKDVQAGFSPQLALLGWLVQQQIGAEITGLYYWKIAQASKGVDRMEIEDAPARVEQIEQALHGLMQYYYQQQQPFDASIANKPNTDYAHLARRAS